MFSLPNEVIELIWDKILCRNKNVTPRNRDQYALRCTCKTAVAETSRLISTLGIKNIMVPLKSPLEAMVEASRVLTKFPNQANLSSLLIETEPPAKPPSKILTVGSKGPSLAPWFPQFMMEWNQRLRNLTSLTIITCMVRARLQSSMWDIPVPVYRYICIYVDAMQFHSIISTLRNPDFQMPNKSQGTQCHTYDKHRLPVP